MTFDDERELESVLFDHWFTLRKAGRFGRVLPRCGEYGRKSRLQRVSEHGQVRGWRVDDHRLHRQLPIPGSGASSGMGYADLVETYWEVSLLDDKPDLDRRPCLYLNVVELKNRPLVMADVEQLVRYTSALGSGLRELGLDPDEPSEFGRRDMKVYVYGVLLGPSFMPEVVQFLKIISAIWPEYTDYVIRLGRFHLHPLDGLTITSLDEFLDDTDDTSRAATIQQLVGKGAMFGPLYEERHRWDEPPAIEDQNVEPAEDATQPALTEGTANGATGEEDQ